MTNDIVDFDKRLTKAMEERGISQADLCRLTGLASSMVSHYCTGQRMPSIAAALKIAKALGTTVSFLAYGEKRKSAAVGEQVEEANVPYEKEKTLLRDNEDKEELIDKICLLNLEGQTKVLVYIEDLLATGKYK
ncbi:MAG: helix-turn-helix transcriptional regulator [Oscillospiraceae bacterium]|nr:helix-turn-helix transcriptional regulator [Oscillospiraceae bacterium]MCL2278963.1 helix-turn-helix transcriptional regulator [Oscillospiraceae bacterium]